MRLPKRSGRTDLNTLAYRIVQAATAEEKPADPDSGKNPAAVALGKLGGSKGGKARAAKLSARRRSEIAKKAARARWAGERNRTRDSH